MLLCCATALLFHLSHSQMTLDVSEPIVREAPAALDADGYFGYSVVLHRKSDGPWYVGVLGAKVCTLCIHVS